MQFDKVYVLRCAKCGRLFKTVGGAERHKGKCRMVPPLLDGQFSLFAADDHQPDEMREGKR